MDKDAKDYTYLNDYHREQHERAKTFLSTQPNQSLEEVMAQYERQERLSGQTRQSRRVKESEPPSGGNSGS